MPCRLNPEEIVTIQVLSEKQVPARAIARQIGAAESTVRYHLQRAREGATDGRKDKPFAAAAFASVIERSAPRRSKAALRSRPRARAPSRAWASAVRRARRRCPDRSAPTTTASPCTPRCSCPPASSSGSSICVAM